MFYPFSKELQEASKNFSHGNFGLWFNKLVPLDENKEFKTGDKAVMLYRDQYDRLKNSKLLKSQLQKRHEDHRHFCQMHAENGAGIIEIKAELKTPLITGIGNTHPSEVGMTLDHTLGIPYIPATSIKGLVRLAHILNLLDDPVKCDQLITGKELDDTHPDSLIPAIFGGDLEQGENQEKRIGSVNFLDAYPEKVPDLHVDIMNSHYGDYYADDKSLTPPADYLNPNLIQFLTVEKGTVFIFRAVIHGNDALADSVRQAFYKALEDEGIGAKTATGYGRFKRLHEKHNKKQDKSLSVEKRQLHVKQESPQTDIWENVTLTWSPGNQLITATASNKKATVTGKDLVPEELHKKLFGKKKRAQASRIVVEPIGNAFKIVKINH